MKQETEWKFRIPEDKIKKFKDMVEYAESVAEHFRISVENDTVKLEGVDKAMVLLYDIELDQPLIKDLETGENTEHYGGLKADRALKFLEAQAENNSEVTVKFADNKYVMIGDQSVTTLAYHNLRRDDVPTNEDLEYETYIEKANKQDIKEFMDLARKHSVKLVAENNDVKLKTFEKDDDDGMDQTRIRFDSMTNVDQTMCLYSREYLEVLFQDYSFVENIYIRFKEDFPIQIKSEIDGAVTTQVIAPRIPDK